MKRAAYRKGAKVKKVTLNICFDICAPHAYTTVSVHCDTVSTKKWPKILRDIADLIESGQLSAEIERELRGLKGVDVDALIRGLKK